MAWVIWHDDDNGRRVYVRRITPTFVSFTLNRDEAKGYPTRAEARRALKGTGLTTYRVSDTAPPEAPDADVIPLS